MALGSHLITVRRLEKYINDVIGKKANLPDTSKTIIGNISQINSDLTQEVSRATSSDANLQAQIDQFVAPSGTAPNPAEIENARIGADGVTYDTLGNAIRGQVSDLKSAIRANIYPLRSEDFESGTWENGQKASSEKRLRTKAKIDVKKGEVLYINSTLYVGISLNDAAPSEYLDGNEAHNYIVPEDGTLCLMLANGKTYGTSTSISISDFNGEFLMFPTFPYTYMEDIYRNGGYAIEQEQIEQGVYENGRKSTSIKRIRYKNNLPIRAGNYLEYDTSMYMLVSVINNNTEVQSSGWITGSGLYQFEHDGNVFLSFANGKNYSESTEISPSDFTGYYVVHNSGYERHIKNLALNGINNNIFVSSYNSIDWRSHVKAFAKEFKNKAISEGFLFFTDAHFMHTPNSSHAPITDSDEFEQRAHIAMSYIEQVFYASPCSFVLNGGDWLGSWDIQDVALYKLGYINGFMRKKFGTRFAMLLGNHDTNYQGYVDSKSERDSNDGRLSNGAVLATYFADKDKAYFVYHANTFDMYCFDTGVEADGLTTDYYKQQIHWFAEALKHNTKAHVAVAMHIIMNAGYYGDMFYEVAQISKAYNNRSEWTIDGISYDYSNIQIGKVAFAIGGHTHEDSTGIYYDLPYIITKNFSGYGELSTYPMDLMIADWDSAKLIAHRIEIGQPISTRSIDINV